MLPRRIYGVDFSGALNAGEKIWIATGGVERGCFMPKDCWRAGNLAGAGAGRDQVLLALRDFIRGEREGIFGLDFPFSLPASLISQSTWEEFVTEFPTLFDNPDHFRHSCRLRSGKMELKRRTDVQFKAPFSPYNLRLYRQTYYGISYLLGSLVKDRAASICPFHRPAAEKPWLVEVCPASTLKSEDLYRPYKGKGDVHKHNRIRILKQLDERGLIRGLDPELAVTLSLDPGGDALDSVLCALGVAQALTKGAQWGKEPKRFRDMEGQIYGARPRISSPWKEEVHKAFQGPAIKGRFRPRSAQTSQHEAD